MSIDARPRNRGQSLESDDHLAMDLSLGMAFVFIFGVVVVVGLWLSSRFQNGRTARQPQYLLLPARGNHDVCVSRGCLEHAHVLNASLAPAFDPCRSMDKFVCSSFAEGHSPRRTDRLGALVSWTLDLFGRRPDSRSGLLRSMSALFRSCLYRSTDDEGRVAAEFLQFMLHRGLFVPSGDGAWPDPPGDARHPLDVLIDLDVNWKVHLWFKMRLLLPTASSQRAKVVIAPSRAVLQPQIQSTSVANTRTLAATRFIIHQRLLMYTAILGAPLASLQYPGVWVDAHESLVARMTETMKAPLSDVVRPPNETYSLQYGSEWAHYTKKHIAHVFGDVKAQLEVQVENGDVAAAIESILAANHYRQYTGKQTEGNSEDNIVLLAAISWWFLELYMNIVSPRALAALTKAGRSDYIEKELTLERVCVVQFHQVYAAAVTAKLANHLFRSHVCRRNVTALLEDVRRLVADATARTSATSVAQRLRSAGILIWPRRETLRAAERLQLQHVGASATVMPSDLTKAPGSPALLSVDTVALSYFQRWLAALNKSRHLLGTPEYAFRYDALHEMVDYDEQGEDFVYRPSQNTLLLPLAALAIPRYSCDATDAVNVGGLGGAFARYLAKAFRLANNVPGDCAELSLQVAYALFARNNSVVSSSPKRPKEFALHKRYSYEQVFFLTYCLNACGRLATNCTELYNKFHPFGLAFRCPANTGNRKTDWVSRCPNWALTVTAA